MATVTYYWNAYTDAVWTNPANMIDGDTGTYGSTSSSGDIQVLDGTTSPGTDLGTISAVEGRAYGYGDGDDQMIVAFRNNGLLHGTLTWAPATSPGWSNYQTLAGVGWADIPAMLAKVEFRKVAKGNTMYCAMVEVRVTYTPPAALPKQVIIVN